MFYWEIIVLACALAVDAVIVSFSYGLVMKEHRFSNGLAIATTTGLLQGLMPALGFLLTGVFFNYIEVWDHWIGFSIFFILGVMVIYNALTEKDSDEAVVAQHFTFKLLVILGVATSIDALVAGTSIYFMMAEAELPLYPSAILLPALIIALVTFLGSFLAFRFSAFLHHLPTRTMEICAGGILILLGLRMLYAHLSCEVF